MTEPTILTYDRADLTAGTAFAAFVSAVDM